VRLFVLATNQRAAGKLKSDNGSSGKLAQILVESGEMTGIPEDQYELYAQFGMAAEKAQILEVAAGNVALSYLTLFYQPDTISADERDMFRSVINDLNKKTLGRLLGHVKSTAQFSESILEIIDDALTQRNYLMHHFFRTHNYAIHSAGGRQKMVDELKDIRNKLALAEATLNGISECLDQFAGRQSAPEDIDAILRANGRQVKI